MTNEEKSEPTNMCRTRTDMAVAAAVVVADYYYTYSKGRCVDECTCMCSSNLLFTVDKRNEEEEEKNLYCCSVRLVDTHTKNVKYQETHSSCAVCRLSVCLSVSRSPFFLLSRSLSRSMLHISRRCIENVDDDGDTILWRKKKNTEKKMRKKQRGREREEKKGKASERELNSDEHE